jgi:hypothetical protein
MPITKYTSLPLGLNDYNVYVEDTTVNSDYFNITRMPQTFTGGRNSFLIGGSEYLQGDTEILIEILDADGNPIYQYAVDDYYEGGSKMISVEIYDTTPSGFATVRIVGILEYTKDGTPVPLEWQNKYNVRWSTKVLVDYELKNVSPLKFITTPQLIVAENRFYNINSSSYIYTTVEQPFTASLSARLSQIEYAGYGITLTGSTVLSSKHLNGKITGSLIINDIASEINLPFSKILNKNRAFTDELIQYPGVNGVIRNIDLYSSSYSASIDSTNTLLISNAVLQYSTINTSSTNIPISYASLRLTDLSTVSGEIYKLRVYSKVASNTGYYKIVGDVPVDTNEIFTTQSIRGNLPIGNIALAENYTSSWYAGPLQQNTGIQVPIYPISGSDMYYDSSITFTPNNFVVSSSDDTLLSSIYVNVPIDISTNMFSGSAVNGYFLGTIPSYTLFASTEYTLQFDAYHSKTSGSITLVGNTPTVDIYLINKLNSVKILDDDPLGQKIGQIKAYGGSQWFEQIQFNFNPYVPNSGSLGLRFVVNNGFWNFSNISIKPASDPQFSPDESLILIPNTEYHNELLEYRVEFFDINNNSANVFATSTPTYFTGSAVDLGVIP